MVTSSASSGRYSSNNNNNKKLDESKLMSSIGLSDSFDSSSDDIIPMQRRKKQRGFTRRRNSRSNSSSSFFLKSNYAYGFCTLVKYVCIVLLVGTLALGLGLMCNLYKRLDSLQINIDGLQSAKSNLPEEMHLIHSHLKSLDQNSTKVKNDLYYVLDLATNMSAEIAQIKIKLGTIVEAIEAAPAIRQLPKDVEDLKKIVAELGSKMTSDDKEIKLAREQQTNHDTLLNSIQSELKILHNNISSIDNQTDSNNSKFVPVFTGLQNQIAIIDRKMTILNNTVDTINKSNNRLDEWRLSIADKLENVLSNHYNGTISLEDQSSISTDFSPQTPSVDSNQNLTIPSNSQM